MTSVPGAPTMHAIHASSTSGGTVVGTNDFDIITGTNLIDDSCLNRAEALYFQALETTGYICH